MSAEPPHPRHGAHLLKDEYVAEKQVQGGLLLPPKHPAWGAFRWTGMCGWLEAAPRGWETTSTPTQIYLLKPVLKNGCSIEPWVTESFQRCQSHSVIGPLENGITSSCKYTLSQKKIWRTNGYKRWTIPRHTCLSNKEEKTEGWKNIIKHTGAI